MKKVTIASLILLLLIACGKKNNRKNYRQTKEQEIVHEIPEGKKLLEKHCFLCHNAHTILDERRAQPIVEIKAIYLKDGATREEFVEDFVGFTKNPTKDNAKMKDALKRFNLMPKQLYSEKGLIKIAEYVYDFEIDEPEWFKNYWEKKHGIPYDNLGKKLVIKTEKQ